MFQVNDRRREHQGDYALKRLGRVSRSDRFRLEVETLQRIDHPNVIRIIDHSGDVSEDVAGYRHWFVMPLAAGGSLEKRLGLYAGNLESVVQVATQLAQGLSAAHALQIVHRDVKPANVLFPDPGDHTVWLSDFGICHVPTDDRLTAVGDVMGPRWFTGPELEAGDPQSVTPAADIYSLGKLIYYMLSGGMRLAREETGDEKFKAVFAKGERYTDLHLLLLRMITSIDRRIKDVGEVVDRLTKIAQWEEVARRPPSTARSQVVDHLHRQSAERQRIAFENEQARKSEQETQQVVGEAIMAWLRARLADEADGLRRPEVIEVEHRDVEFRPGFGGGPMASAARGPKYLPYAGHEMLIRNLSDTFPSKYVLQFFVCRGVGPPMFQVGNAVRPQPARDVLLGVLPYFGQLTGPESRQCHMIMMGYLNRKSELERLEREAHQRMQHMATRRFQPQRQPSISKSFIGEPVTQFVQFYAMDWTSQQGRVEVMIGECIDTVVEYMMADTKVIGA